MVPAHTPAAAVLEREPDGVFLSNGPGDPAAVGYARDNIAALLGKLPVFGICLGHQIMSLATGRIEITSQNHNYAVDAQSLPDGATVTHLNLNDGDLEGMRADHLRAFSVQYHPEAGPGPHDARYLFAEFTDLMRAG